MDDSQGNHGYSSGEDSPQRHSSSSTYTRPNLPQDPQRSPLTSTPTYSQSYSQASPSGRSGDEAHLVDDMCTPGGLRAQPDREDLRLFVENAASLNGTTVAELLQAKMVCACIPSVVTCGHARYRSKRMRGATQSCATLSDVIVRCMTCETNCCDVHNVQAYSELSAFWHAD